MSETPARPEDAPTQDQTPAPPIEHQGAPAPRVVEPAAVAPGKDRPFRRGFGLGFGASLGVGVVVTVLSIIGSLIAGAMLFALAGAMKNANTATVQPLKTVWGAQTAKHTLRQIDISGTILTDPSEGSLFVQGTYGYEVADMIDKLGAADADGLVLRLSTPGGTITGSKAIADAVKRYRDRTGKKVFAFVSGLSASGGVYSMAGADKIVADYGSMVGSIGVLFGPFVEYKDVKAIEGGLAGGGVTTTGGIKEYYLTQGRGKDVGNPFRAMTDEERKLFTAGLSGEYDAFVNHVSTNRKIPAQTIKDVLGAHLFSGQQAVQNHLIDAVMGRDDAYRAAADLAGVAAADTKVVTAEKPGPLASLLGADSRVFGQAPAIAAGAKPSARVCGASPTVLVYSGSLASACNG